MPAWPGLGFPSASMVRTFGGVLALHHHHLKGSRKQPQQLPSTRLTSPGTTKLWGRVQSESNASIYQFHNKQQALQPVQTHKHAFNVSAKPLSTPSRTSPCTHATPRTSGVGTTRQGAGTSAANASCSPGIYMNMRSPRNHEELVCLYYNSTNAQMHIPTKEEKEFLI